MKEEVIDIATTVALPAKSSLLLPFKVIDDICVFMRNIVLLAYAFRIYCAGLLFRLFDYKKVKRAWIENVVAQGERYYNLNYFFAWYYFHAKQPRRYVKSMATRQLNKRLAA